MRKEINQIVRDYAQKNGGCYEATWNYIYRLYNRQNHTYIKARARHRKIRPLDVVEKMNGLGCLICIAKAVLA